MTTAKLTIADVSIPSCTRLREFKEFLHIQLQDGTGAEQIAKNCVTRSSNETYIVNQADEREAEVIHTLWTQLQTKRCPYHFQLKLLHAALNALEFRKVKECEETLNTQYDLLKLQKLVVNHLEKMLTNLTDNAVAEQLQNYADPGEICIGCTTQCQCTVEQPLAYAIAHIKNKPRKMEDRHVCLERFSELYQTPGAYSFYGVFDGHSGALAASYAASQLPYLLAVQLQQIRGDDTATSDAFREAFEAAFLQTDERFSSKRITSGTTVACVLLANPNATVNRRLYVAWIGDSKALLVGAKANLQLVKAHKPDAVDERKRIETAGGTVIFAQGQWRVNGILNLARSIGDYNVEAVIAEPDFVDVEITSAHDFLVLGTDGLWDHLAESTVSEIVYAALSDATQKLEDIPKMLIEAAKEGDSQDNITAVVVLLKARERISENYCKQ